MIIFRTESSQFPAIPSAWWATAGPSSTAAPPVTATCEATSLSPTPGAMATATASPRRCLTATRHDAIIASRHEKVTAPPPNVSSVATGRSDARFQPE